MEELESADLPARVAIGIDATAGNDGRHLGPQRRATAGVVDTFDAGALPAHGAQQPRVLAVRVQHGAVGIAILVPR